MTLVPKVPVVSHGGLRATRTGRANRGRASPVVPACATPPLHLRHAEPAARTDGYRQANRVGRDSLIFTNFALFAALPAYRGDGGYRGVVPLQASRASARALSLPGHSGGIWTVRVTDSGPRSAAGPLDHRGPLV